MNWLVLIPAISRMSRTLLLFAVAITRAGVLLFTDKHYLAQTATYTKVGMFGERRSD